MSDQFTESFMDPSRIESLISGETRAFMAQMLDLGPETLGPTQPEKSDRNVVQNLAPVSPIPSAPIPLHLSSIIPALIGLVERILQELESNLSKLLSLNPSRRDAIVQHLNRLAGLPPGSPASKSMEPASGLRRWIEEPRSASQNAAVRTYFEEIAIITLGQTLVLKAWSDRGIRKWTVHDLGRLNWALSTALKPHLPLDREGWQITRPNLYSWYNPSPSIQQEMWNALDAWKVVDEGSSFLQTLLNPVRRAQPEVFEPQGYDPRFFRALWDHSAVFGFNPQPEAGLIKRNKIAFSPTLRDSSLVRTGPFSINWVGLESSPYQLLMAELMQIWWNPCAPPFWSVGTGLEVHARDQLTFPIGSPKPSVLCRIAEMEACDLAVVLEEQTVRLQGRNAVTARFREQVDQLPYFKKLKTQGTSLGDLQACVALSKLRPQGLLFWAREEALCAKDGSDVLAFLLDRAKLICEWDFSELEHSLPAGIPLYPKHFYLFQRETNLEARLSHRPIRHAIQGQMRSHVELPLVLNDAFLAASRPTPTQTQTQPHGHWTVLSHMSPTPQRDWLDKWPDPASHHMVRRLDQLRMASLPLANFTTIRPTPEGDSKNGNWSAPLALRGFWISAEHTSEGRRLNARLLPEPGQSTSGSGFMIVVPDESWIPPLRVYLMSDLVQKWLDHHAERRGDRWVLNEQVVKWIPVPKGILRELGVPNAFENSGQGMMTPPSALPDPWEKLASEVTYQPTNIKQALEKISQDESSSRIHSVIFLRAARALDDLKSGQDRLFSLVTSDGRIRWRELMEILPKGECVPITLHPQIRLSGSLPPHLPIDRIDKVKVPAPGILFATTSGFSLHLACENSLLFNVLWDELQGLSHPTWNELLQYLSLPRKVEFAETTALDVLRSHGEQMARLRELEDLLATCQLY